MTQRRVALAVLMLVIVGAGCGSDDAPAANGPLPAASVVSESAAPLGADSDSDPTTDDTVDAGEPSDAAGTTPATDDSGQTAAGGEPLPPLPDPAPALACDGSTVLCVDASAGDGGVGTADAPLVSIREAIALAGQGGTIQVAAGTYAEPIVLDQMSDLSLVGGFVAGGDFSTRDGHANETVLEGTGEASVVSITGSSGIHLEGFRITGGGGSTDTYSWFGGGVYVDAASSGVAIVGNRIHANAVDHGDDPTSTFGGGVATYGTDVTIVGNVIEANGAGRGSGIAAIGGSTTIQRNVVRDNVSVGDHGGGVYAAGDVRILDNRIEGNRVGEALGYGWGGGVIVFGDDTTATLQGNVVTGNLAVGAGSGVFVDDGADATLVDEIYAANLCTTDGGTQMLVDTGGETTTVAELRNVTITATDCTNSGNGGAVLIAASDPAAAPCSVSITSSILWGNGGDDVQVSGCELTITDSVVEQPLDAAIDGGGNLGVDPMFVDPAAGDYTLDPTSPALGRGAGAAPS